MAWQNELRQLHALQRSVLFTPSDRGLAVERKRPAQALELAGVPGSRRSDTASEPAHVRGKGVNSGLTGWASTFEATCSSSGIGLRGAEGRRRRPRSRGSCSWPQEVNE